MRIGFTGTLDISANKCFPTKSDHKLLRNFKLLKIQ